MHARVHFAGATAGPCWLGVCQLPCLPSLPGAEDLSRCGDALAGTRPNSACGLPATRSSLAAYLLVLPISPAGAPGHSRYRQHAAGARAGPVVRLLHAIRRLRGGGRAWLCRPARPLLRRQGLIWDGRRASAGLAAALPFPAGRGRDTRGRCRELHGGQRASHPACAACPANHVSARGERDGLFGKVAAQHCRPEQGAHMPNRFDTLR